jgi:hypothetical protein
MMLIIVYLQTSVMRSREQRLADIVWLQNW